MRKNFHLFHLVELSPWPFTIGIVSFSLIRGLLVIFKSSSSFLLISSLTVAVLVSGLWWRDVSREGTFQGAHRSYVQKGLKLGIILFIFSEVLFFRAFFWTFFHSRLNPLLERGLMWPPSGIRTLNPFQIPILNTIILLRSGISVTWFHHSFIFNKLDHIRILATIILGGYFSFLQWWEYNEALYTIADSIYGRVFFLATGFHGLHVLIGTFFLVWQWIRISATLSNSYRHVGLEASIWYWHFVDVVWLFLFRIIYWWGWST